MERALVEFQRVLTLQACYAGLASDYYLNTLCPIVRGQARRVEHASLCATLSDTRSAGSVKGLPDSNLDFPRMDGDFWFERRAPTSEVLGGRHSRI